MVPSTGEDVEIRILASLARYGQWSLRRLNVQSLCDPAVPRFIPKAGYKEETCRQETCRQMSCGSDRQNSQKVETTPGHIGWQMEEPEMLYLHSGCSSDIKIAVLLRATPPTRPWKHHVRATRLERPELRIPSMRNVQDSKSVDGEEVGGCQGAEGREVGRDCWQSGGDGTFWNQN